MAEQTPASGAEESYPIQQNVPEWGLAHSAWLVHETLMQLAPSQIFARGQSRLVAQPSDLVSLLLQATSIIRDVSQIPILTVNPPEDLVSSLFQAVPKHI
jgi:hypothetical protein